MFMTTHKYHSIYSARSPPPNPVVCPSSLLVVVEVGLEVVDKCQHLVCVSKGQEWNEPHERLQHAYIGADEGAVDTIQQHHQLLTVTTQLGELLHTDREWLKDNVRVEGSVHD